MRLISPASASIRLTPPPASTRPSSDSTTKPPPGGDSCSGASGERARPGSYNPPISPTIAATSSSATGSLPDTRRTSTFTPPAAARAPPRPRARGREDRHRRLALAALGALQPGLDDVRRADRDRPLERHREAAEHDRRGDRAVRRGGA